MVGASLAPISIGATLNETNERNQMTVEEFQRRVPQSIQGRNLNRALVADDRDYTIAYYESLFSALQIQYFPSNDPRIVVMLQTAHYNTSSLEDAVSMVEKFVRRVDVDYTRENEGFECRLMFEDGTTLTVGFAKWQKYDVVVNGRVIEFEDCESRNQYVSNFVISKIK